MANTNTPNVAALLASPPTFNKMKDVGSQTITTKDTASWTGTTAADTLRLCKVPVSATLDSILIQCDDLGGTNQTWDLGLYTGDTFAVVDIDCLTAAEAAASANAVDEYRFKAQDHTTLKERMWEIAGLSTEPAYGEFYLVMSVKVADTPIAGDVSFYCTYTL